MAEVDVHRMGQSPPKPIAALSSDAAILGGAAAPPDYWHEARVAAELFRVRKPAHVADLGDQE